MPQMTGGEAVVAMLRRLDIDTVFGIPGVHTGGLYDALLDASDVRQVMTRHEQGAAFMADGYARASGRVACLSTITGPGITNAATGLGEAYADSSPVLHIATSVEVRAPGFESGDLHEMRDQSGLLRSLVAHHDTVAEVPEIPAALLRAMHAICTGRPGPASVEIPLGLLSQRAEVTLPESPRFERTGPSLTAIEDAAQLLAAAASPVIYVGGGGMDAGPAIVTLAERLQAPIMTFPSGKGAVPESHPLALGCPARSNPALLEFLQSRDVGLVIGARLGRMPLHPERVFLPERLVQIDLDQSVLGLNRPVEVGIHAEAAAALAALLKVLPARATATGLVAAVAGVRADRATRAELAAAPDILAAIRSALPADAVLANDMTRVSYEAPAFFPLDRPRSFLYPVYFGTLGFSYPAALGAQIACPDRAVVSLSGDGGFLFTSEELATAVRESLPVVALVVNDGQYGAIDSYLRRTFDGRALDMRLHNPDFRALAQAYGVSGARVTRADDLAAEVRAALARGAPSLIEFALA